jgi:hypothetical protein
MSRLAALALTRMGGPQLVALMAERLADERDAQ